MGVDLHCYFGPYLACGLKNNKKMPRKVTVNPACFNPNCKNKGKQSGFKFCPYCGEETQAGCEEIFEDSIDMYIVEAQINERLSNILSVGGQCECPYAKDNNLHIWISNEEIPTLKADVVDYGSGDQYMPIVSGEMIEKHKDAFVKRFVKQIATIKEVYGEDQVKVEWGIFNYYM